MLVYRKKSCCYLRFIAVACVAVVTLAGCGPSQIDRMYSEAYGANIKSVSNLYCMYQGRHRQVGPKDETELKNFIAQLPADYLEKFGVDPAKLDELFISERDGQPFKIRWGLRFQIPQPPLPIAFEAEGVDGKYEVGFSSFIVEEVDQQEYDKLWSEKVTRMANTRGAR